MAVSTATTAAPETFAAGKAVSDFRVYDAPETRVRNHYTKMRTRQTLAFVRSMEAKYFKFDKATMTIWEAFEKLDDFVDASDPDTDNPNLEHMLQTAERMRADGKPDWMVLTGLLHDLGKIMFLWGDGAVGQDGTAGGDQWALGGDTWVVGCRIPDCTIMPDLNALNPDMADPVLSTPLGVYEPGCGLRNLRFAFGHDEYLYRMLVHNGATIPEEGLACIRLHSCYPWHTGGAYKEFHAPGDDAHLAAVREFNKYDLYTKADDPPDVDALRPYYQRLIDKYIPGELHW